jgi:hypothetical protein
MATMRSLFRIVAAVTALTLSVSTVASAQHGSGDPGIASFLSAVNSIGDQLKAFNAEKKVSAHDIHVVNVAQLANEGNSVVLNKAIAKNSAQIATLRDALKNNAAVVAALSSANLSVGQVVAIDVDAGCEIHVYYQPGS